MGLHGEKGSAAAGSAPAFPVDEESDPEQTTPSVFVFCHMFSNNARPPARESAALGVCRHCWEPSVKYARKT